MFSLWTKILMRRLARVWIAVALGMLASFFATWELAALMRSVFLFNVFSALYWICPAVGLAWSGVLVYRAAKGSVGARAV